VLGPPIGLASRRCAGTYRLATCDHKFTTLHSGGAPRQWSRAAVSAGIATVPAHLRPSTWRCGSLFCGMYDALFSLHRCTARGRGSRRHPRRRKDSMEAGCGLARPPVPPRSTRDAFAPADDDLPNLEMLFWTPPCPCVSTGGQMSPVSTHEKRARALFVTRRAATAVSSSTHTARKLKAASLPFKR